jgi:hypothetical protein
MRWRRLTAGSRRCAERSEEEPVVERINVGVQELPGVVTVPSYSAPAPPFPSGPPPTGHRCRSKREKHCCIPGAKLLHHVELAFGLVHIAAALRFGHRRKIAERLKADLGQCFSARYRTSCGDPSKVSRSFSKISTPAKPVAAAASIVSARVPPREDHGDGLRQRADRDARITSVNHCLRPERCFRPRRAQP